MKGRKSLFKKRAPRKRINRRRRRGSRRIQTNGRSRIVFRPGKMVFPFPQEYVTTLQCSAFGYTASGAGSGDYHITFPLNSPYYPMNPSSSAGITWSNITPAAYNPAGMVSLLNANLYHNYRIVASSIELSIVPQSVTDSVSCAITPSISQTNPTNVNLGMDSPLSTRCEFLSGRGRQILKNYCTLHKFMGVSRRAIDDDLSGQFTGQVGANPTTQLWWVVNFETGDNAILSQSLEVRCTIKYYVVFFNNVEAVPLRT